MSILRVLLFKTYGSKFLIKCFPYFVHLTLNRKHKKPRCIKLLKLKQAPLRCKKRTDSRLTLIITSFQKSIARSIHRFIWGWPHQMCKRAIFSAQNDWLIWWAVDGVTVKATESDQKRQKIRNVKSMWRFVFMSIVR